MSGALRSLVVFSRWRRRGGRHRALPVLLGLVFAAGFATAQEPVPTGELGPVRTGELGPSQLRGRCLSSDGEALPGVLVEARGSGTGTVGNAVSDADGRFRIVGLVPDRYTVRATLEGFSTQIEILTLSPGSASELVFTFAGPVPTGEPRVAATPVPPGELGDVSTPDPTPPGRRIERRAFADDLELDSWLRIEAGQGWALRAVVPEAAGTSLFALARRPGGDCLVVRESWPLDGERLAQWLQRHAARRLAGVHRLDGDAAVLVLCGE